MLKLKYLYENYDLAKECLKRYEHSGKRLDEMLSYYRISSNAIYPFFARERKICFLRLSPVEEKTIGEVNSEIRFLTYLISEGFPAMKPYPMKDGKLSDVVCTAWGKYNVSCFERVAGETLEDFDGTPKTAFGYGRTLGELHNLSERYPASEERRSYREMLTEARKRFEDYRADKSVLRFYDEVSEKLESLSQNAQNFGLIHYDFEPDNVLYDDDLDAFGVIDFDDSIRCWYALDLARAIDAMDDVVEKENVDEAVDAFLAGYRSVRAFTQEQEDSLPLMRDLVAIESYATILHVLSDPIEDEPDWMLEIKEKLNRTLQKLEERMR